MLVQTSGATVDIVKAQTPAAEHKLSAIQAAARFEPLMQVGNSSNPTGQLPVDILIELADLGQSPLSGTTVSSTGQAGQTPPALAMAATNEQAITAPLVGAATVKPASVVTPTPAMQTQATTIVADIVPAKVAGMAAQETAEANKVAHSPVAGVTLDKESVGLTVAAIATTKMAGTAATPATPLNGQPNQAPTENAILPQQAAVQATLKSHAQPAVQAQTNHAPQAGQSPVEIVSQANTNNGQSSNNSSSEGQSHSGTSGQGQNSNANNQSQQQMAQDKPTHQQIEMKADLKAAHNTAPTTHNVPQPLSQPAPATPSKILSTDFTSDLITSPADVRATQATITAKVFGGTLTQSNAKNVAQQVGLEVTRAARAGNTEFTIKLNPVELGKVTIKMAFDKDGTTSLKVLAQSPETVALLQRDIRGLERAIEAGGLKSAQSDISIELDTQHDGQSAGKAFAEAARDEMAQENNNKSSALKENEMAHEPQDEEITPLEQILAQLDSASGLDIRV